MLSIVRLAVILFAALICLPVHVLAQTYPNRSINLIVPFDPGGAADLVARLLAAKLTDTLKTPVVIQNKPGAANIVGTQVMAAAAPDGYTIGLVTIAHAGNPSFHKLPYDPIKDFTFISLITKIPAVIIVNDVLGVHSVHDLIALAKSKPNQINFSSNGVGSSNYLAMAQFMVATGTKFTHIPYTNSGVMNGDLTSGYIPVAFVTTAPGIALSKSGKVKILAVATAQRVSVLPEIPTLAESGVPGFEFYDWQAIVGPAHIPPEILKTLNTAINAALADPDLKSRITNQGAQVVGTTPEALSSFVTSEIARWHKIADETGIAP